MRKSPRMIAKSILVHLDAHLRQFYDRQVPGIIRESRKVQGP